MNITAKTEYACLAALELAILYNMGTPVQIRRIAEQHGIPARFLVQILLQLKGAGLVISTRGASGGYRLSKAPKNITLAQVMDAVERDASRLRSNLEHETTASIALLSVWQDVTHTERAMLEAVTLADLVERVSAKTSNMYYI